MKILVTGGAGYIGSFMTKRLCDDGLGVVVADSLERGFEDAVDKRAQLIKGDLNDRDFVEKVFSENEISAVIHFAAYISVGESMTDPGKYFRNNVLSPVNILDAMSRHEVKNFIFSSTAGVYGNPVKIPIPEDHQKDPESPYGESKLMVEKILHWYHKVHNISFVALRYFNAAGAALDGSLGERHDPETHIIPNAIKAVLRKEKFTLFGTDYETPDGTCVRDYIHVLDLVEAHVLALKKIESNPDEYQYNVGTGKGYSNKEVAEMVRKISQLQLDVVEEDRRAGDPSELVADVQKIQAELNFSPKHSDLETIVSSAWTWHKQKELNQ